MKTITLCLVLLCSSLTFAQENWKEIAKKDLKEQKKVFEDTLVKYHELNFKAGESLNKESAEYKTAAKKLQTIVKNLDSLYSKRENSISFYSERVVPNDSLKIYFPIPYYKPVKQPDEATGEKKISIIYGDGKIIEEVEITGNSKTKPILEEIFSEKSETYLGDFQIPGYRQKVKLYKRDDDKRGKKTFFGQVFGFLGDRYNITADTSFLYFESVKVSIREGGMYEIKATLSNKEDSQKYYFINTVPISLLRYMKVAESSYLENTLNGSNKVESEGDKTYLDKYIRLADVLQYFNATGNNFVPDDEDYCFPPKNDETNQKSLDLRLYKIRQDTNLQNIMELRTYTDFLGMFDDESPNGLVQIEGKADFYLAPFQVNDLFPMTFFNKTTPYVSYARIDDELKDIEPVPSEIEDGKQMYMVEKPLELLEKAYIDMGVITDVITASPTKDFPFSITGYFPVRYKVATIGWGDGSEDNFKTIGLGLGIRIDVKRFNNFGFRESVEWTKFNHLNRIDNLDMVDNFWVFRNESEIFYYPNKSKKQSIFLRLRSYLNITDGEDSFFQLQFGYRFAIGLGKKT